MGVLLLATNRALLRVAFSDLKDFALLGVLGIAGSNYTYYMAIQLTNVGIAILMQYTAPAMVAIYMLLSRQERISRIKALAIVLSLGGSATMLGAFNLGAHISTLGIFLGLLSAVCFSFFNVYYKVATKHYSIQTAVTWTLISAGLFWLVLDIVSGIGRAPTGPSEVGILVLFSISSILIPYYFYFHGLKYLSPSTAIIVTALEPVVAIATSFVFLGEALSISQMAGGIFIVLAVILLEVYKE